MRILRCSIEVQSELSETFFPATILQTEIFMIYVPLGSPIRDIPMVTVDHAGNSSFTLGLCDLR